MRKFLVIVAAIVAAFFIITAIIAGLGVGTPKVTTARVVVFAEVSTCWSGQIGDATQDGCGRAEFDIKSDIGIFVAVVQKKSDDAAVLTVRITPTGKPSKETTTTAAFGVVTVTAQG